MSRRATIEQLIQATLDTADGRPCPAQIYQALNGEGWLRNRPRAHGALDDVELAPPYGPHAVYRAFGDPAREEIARRLRAEYEAADKPSIRALAQRHDTSFNLIRSLLAEAGAPIRAQGGYHPRRHTTGATT